MLELLSSFSSPPNLAAPQRKPDLHAQVVARPHGIDAWYVLAGASKNGSTRGLLGQKVSL